MTHYLESALKTGLSAKAGSVYVALLEAGVALSPKSLINRTKLHRQYVYDGLHELEQKHLVTVRGNGRHVMYEATNPEKLRQDAEKVHIDTLEGVRALTKLFDRSAAGVVEIIRGTEAAVAFDFQQIESANEGDFLDIIGGGGMHWVHMLEGKMEEWEAIRKRKGVKIRYIGEGEDVRFNKEKSISENESRVISGIGDIVNVVIRKDSVVFNMYNPETIYVWVKNEATAASQRALFEVLWKVAE